MTPAVDGSKINMSDRYDLTGDDIDRIFELGKKPKPEFDGNGVARFPELERPNAEYPNPETRHK